MYVAGQILSIDIQNQSTIINIHHGGGPVEYSCPISHLQHIHKDGDWVKVFAGLDKGIEGCVVNHVKILSPQSLDLGRPSKCLPSGFKCFSN